MYVCMYVEGISALLDSPPTCYKARDINCHKSGHCTSHVQRMVKKTPQNWWDLMWVSNHILITNSGRASVTVGVCTSVADVVYFAVFRSSVHNTGFYTTQTNGQIHGHTNSGLACTSERRGVVQPAEPA